jgi:hypothetical protein
MTRKYSSISVETTLASSISNSATSMTVASGTGSALLGGVTLSPGNVDTFGIALDVDTQNEEIVFITAINGDTFTIVRGQAGTSGITHTSGASVKHVLNSSDLNAFESGTIVANDAVPESIVTAKADILVGASSGVVDNLPVGTNGQVLTANSAQTLGLNWTTPTTGDVTLTGTQTLTNKTLTDPVITQAIATPTFTSNAYTLVAGDAGKLLLASNSTTAGTVRIPTNASVPFAIGTQITILQTGSGQLTIQAASPGTTVVISNGASTPDPKCRVAYSPITCVKTGTDTWYAVGDIV